MAKILPARPAVCPVCGGTDVRRYGRGFACSVFCMDRFKQERGIPIHAQLNRVSLKPKGTA